MSTVTVIGVGRLGGALAIALSKVGYSVRQLVSRSSDIEAVANEIEPRPAVLMASEPARFDSDIVFITTGDSEIEPTAKAVADKLDPSAVVLHASGSLSSSVLKSAVCGKNPTGSLHPLLSVSHPLAGAVSFRDVYFCVEGDAAAVGAAEKIVRALGGRSFTIDPAFKPLYHASAVLAAGHVTALFSLATKALAACGPSRDAATEILLPLLESTVRNLATDTPERALTGPFARGDLQTVQLHIHAFMDAGMTDALDIYLNLGLRSAELAEKSGTKSADIERLREYIKLAKGTDR